MPLNRQSITWLVFGNSDSKEGAACHLYQDKTPGRRASGMNLSQEWMVSQENKICVCNSMRKKRNEIADTRAEGRNFLLTLLKNLGREEDESSCRTSYPFGGADERSYRTSYPFGGTDERSYWTSYPFGDADERSCRTSSPFDRSVVFPWGNPASNKLLGFSPLSLIQQHLIPYIYNTCRDCKALFSTEADFSVAHAEICRQSFLHIAQV
jgi:hypothetical protein